METLSSPQHLSPCTYIAGSPGPAQIFHSATGFCLSQELKKKDALKQPPTNAPLLPGGAYQGVRGKTPLNWWI